MSDARKGRAVWRHNGYELVIEVARQVVACRAGQYSDMISGGLMVRRADVAVVALFDLDRERLRGPGGRKTDTFQWADDDATSVCLAYAAINDGAGPILADRMEESPHDWTAVFTPATHAKVMRFIRAWTVRPQYESALDLEGFRRRRPEYAV